MPPAFVAPPITLVGHQWSPIFQVAHFAQSVVPASAQACLKLFSIAPFVLVLLPSGRNLFVKVSWANTVYAQNMSQIVIAKDWQKWWLHFVSRGQRRIFPGQTHLLIHQTTVIVWKNSLKYAGLTVTAPLLSSSVPSVCNPKYAPF